jgi:hypothetical protein
MKLNITNRNSYLSVSSVGIGLGFANLPATEGIKVNINGRPNGKKSAMGSKGRRAQG